MRRSIALVAALALFVVGVLVGSLGTRLYLVERYGPPGPPDPGGRHFVRRMARQLDLTDEQLRQVEAIVRESRAEVEALHREMLPRARSHIARTEERIREVLSEEQREHFEEIRRRHRARAERLFLSR
jgi:Spy/CpxP family protein refolding chaperone